MRERIFSMAYRKIRSLAKEAIYQRQLHEGRPQDLEEVMEWGDTWLRRMAPLGKLLFDFTIPEGIGVDLYDLHFDSPLMLSSFKEEVDVIALWMRLGLGGAVMKTAYGEVRPGNARPRLQEVHVEGDACFINAMGFPFPGMATFLDHVYDSGIFSFGRPIGFSVGGPYLPDFKKNFLLLHQRLDHSEAPYFYEFDISCFNIEGGQSLLKDSSARAELFDLVREHTDAVIGVKMSPDSTDNDIVTIGEQAKTYDRVYLNFGNTSYRSCADVGLPSSAITRGGGGLSGPAMFPRTLELVTFGQREIGLPMVATGGINSAARVREVQDAGATVCGIATAVPQDMYCIPKINKELARGRYLCG